MDSITQGLLGATTAQLGFRQKIGPSATWVAALAAYSPDLDTFFPALAKLGGNHDPFLGLLTHRAWTHSLLLAPAIALVFALPWMALRKLWLRRKRSRPGGDGTDPPGKASFGLLYACCLVGVLTHAPLDLMTSYGTQLFSPLTNHRYALHAVGIIDFVYTPLLIFTLLACWLVRKIRSGRTRRITLAIGWAGMILSCSYLAAGYVLRGRAVDEALARHQPEAVVSAQAYPTIGTIFLWRTVIQTPDAWIVTRIHHLSDSSQPPRSSVAAKAPENELIRRARTTRAYRIYDWFSSGNLRAQMAKDSLGRPVVRFHDMRYSMGTDSLQSLWPLEVGFGPDGDVRYARRSHARRDGTLGEFAAALWRDIWDF
jgi:inner membrane protein